LAGPDAAIAIAGTTDRRNMNVRGDDMEPRAPKAAETEGDAGRSGSVSPSARDGRRPAPKTAARPKGDPPDKGVERRKLKVADVDVGRKGREDESSHKSAVDLPSPIRNPSALSPGSRLRPTGPDAPDDSRRASPRPRAATGDNSPSGGIDNPEPRAVRQRAHTTGPARRPLHRANTGPLDRKARPPDPLNPISEGGAKFRGTRGRLPPVEARDRNAESPSRTSRRRATSEDSKAVPVHLNSGVVKQLEHALPADMDLRCVDVKMAGLVESIKGYNLEGLDLSNLAMDCESKVQSQQVVDENGEDVTLIDVHMHLTVTL